MKKTDLAKSDAKKLMNQTGPRDKRIGVSSPAPADRREQRERDRALGLVPFAVKLNSDLVQQLHVLAKDRDLDMNQLVGDLLQKGLAS